MNRLIRAWIRLAFVLSLGFGAGVFGASPGESESVPPDTVITLQRDACEMRCAVYRLVIFADGTVLYFGEYNVRHVGAQRRKIDPDTVRELVRAFDSAGYFGFKDQYGYTDTGDCDLVVSDAPIAITSLVSGGKFHSVIHQHRCQGATPAKLTELEDQVDRAAMAIRWIK